MKRKGGDRTKAKMLGKEVLIWSGEHHAWWRTRGEGYTDSKSEAGIWPFIDAFGTTSHCGREKKIIYVEVFTSEPQAALDEAAPHK